ncbi:hypothetical protein ACHAW6_007448, partial [Cyclotella cf. meneghiniana]
MEGPFHFCPCRSGCKVSNSQLGQTYSTSNPHIELVETFDYNRMPLAPICCAVQLHDKPKRHKTFGKHATDGWYIKTSSEHYRCHIIFVQKMQQMRITDTEYFKHKYLMQPTLTAQEGIVKAIQDLTLAITGK